MIKTGFFYGNTSNTQAGVANYSNSLIKNIRSEIDVTIIRHNSGLQWDGTHDIILRYPAIPFNTIAWSAAAYLQKKLYNHLDLIHNPAHYPLPGKPHGNTILTIHDITPFLMPDYHTKYRNLYMKVFLPRNVRSATHIISVSKATKYDLIKKFAIPGEKISVIYEAADKIYHQVKEEEKQRIRNTYKLKKPYILFIGTLEPRKNIPTLIQAFSNLIKRVPGYELVIAGRKGWNYQEIFMTVQRYSLHKSVRFIDYIPHLDLPALYCSAELFVYPSWYEGFGLPPLEAMQCGIPVIVSDRGSLPEVVGPGGCMVKPDDPSSLAEAMEAFLKDSSLKKEQISYNLYRTKQFSWEKCARETISVYKKGLNDD